jgi:hypothetical protein
LEKPATCIWVSAIRELNPFAHGSGSGHTFR